MRIAFVVAATLGLAGTAAASPAPETSWGKAGVSFEDYRLDASRCLELVERADLSGTAPARALAQASRQIENAMPVSTTLTTESAEVPPEFMIASARIARIVEQVRPEQRIAEARQILQAAMNECLTVLGYRRFRLTEEQRRQLSRLTTRTLARQRYLHSLASNPAILAAQAE